MALLSLLFVLVQSLIQYPQPAGDGLDEATHRRMQERQELLDREMARLLQELEQQDEGWGAVLFGALQQWPFWLLAGVLLLLGLCFSCLRRSCEASSSGKDRRPCKPSGDKRGQEQGEDSADWKEGGENLEVTVEADESGTGNDREGSPVPAGEGDKDSDAIEGNDDDGKVKAVSEKEGGGGGKAGRGSGGTEEREETRDAGNQKGALLLDTIEWPVQDLERGCSVTAELMGSFTRVFVDSVSNSFYPVPQEAIGVGSAFEGWSPCEWDGVYRVLVPLNPPPGHAFHLELSGAGQVAGRTFSDHVELVCTCKREQPDEKLLCLLHHSQEELRQKPKRSLLGTLCTGSYLDVEKTSQWFCQLVRSSWLHVPQSHSWHLVLQSRSRSCQLQLSKGKKSLTVEMLFGVRQGDSDIFVVSQPAEAQEGGSSSSVISQPAETECMASTAWPKTYAVAEAKFFQHIATQVPCDSLHLRCLQLFTGMLRGTGFSSSTWKTVVMHVLTTVPLSRWRRREFVWRLWDIMAYLHRCLKQKRLEHFVLGSQRLPAEISLLPAMRRLEPLNLFEHLAQDPATHKKAMRALSQVRFRLWMLLRGIPCKELCRGGSRLKAAM